MPFYRIALCPFCGHEYAEPLNTYGLHGWITEGYERVYDNRPYQAQLRRCFHLVAINKIINFNGFVPDELSTIKVPTDVPCVTPEFLFDDPPSMVVMHSLPICRIEEDAFVPRYLLYTLVYYAKNAARAYYQRRGQPDQYADDPEFYPATFRTVGPGLDLESWARRGKLLWLDPDTLDLTTWQEGGTRFPYANIQGYKRWLEFNKGKVRFPYSP